MQETFIELVPRTAESLQTEMKDLEQRDISFQGYNLPELRRQKVTFLTPEELMFMRMEGAISPDKKLALHLRTQERDVATNIERIRLLATHGVDMALLVTGDAFDPGQEPATCAHHVLKKMDQPIEAIDIAVGADLYMPQWGRWEQKTDAMHRGVVTAAFTQPIFHPETVAGLAQQTTALPNEKLYAGVTWITHAKGREYWSLMNHVPVAHLPAGESDQTIRANSISQSAEILRLVRQQGYSSYLMPIRGTLDDLETIFALSENNRD
jgi:5,10-methylenetetrahydrofolate reductase